MKRYLNGIEAVIGARNGLARISSVIGDVAPAEKPSAMSTFLKDIRATVPPDIKDGVGTVAGAAAGVLLIPKHRVLGAIGGASLGRNVPALFNPSMRPMAVRNLAQTGGGVVGALVMPKNGIAGFVLGWLAAGVVVYFDELSNAFKK